MNLQNFARLDITPSAADGKLVWDVPAGRWKIMVFSCVPEGPLMDYMNREATKKFLQLTHEEYYQRFASAHHVSLTGHMDQEQVENVALISGDLLKVFQHQSIPGVDAVFAYRRTERAYKLISSAAYNWDHGLVMSETYGGISNMAVSLLYRMGMDLYAKGINLMVPHAVCRQG